MSAAGLAPNDERVCRIEKLVYGGDGLARVDGRVIFVPGTAAGETVRVRIAQVKPRFARAHLLGVVDAAPDRAPPCCRVEDRGTGETVQIPGCVYDHLVYAAELRAKQEQLDGFLGRLTRDAPVVFLPPVAAPAPLHYRNKIVLHTDADGARLGYRLEPSHRILDLEACPLACDAINAALSALRASGAMSTLSGNTDVTFRYTRRDGAVWWTDDRASADAPPDDLTEESPAGPLRVPRDGFYQVHPAVGDALVRTAALWFSEAPHCSDLLDLYCGVGVFGFACMAKGGTRLTGVESGRAAIAAARLNAKALGIPAAFHCRTLGRGGLRFADYVTDARHTAVVADPPRDGMDASVVRAFAESGVARLFYVSCDPATLARDLAVLLAPGEFRIVRAQLFDMFPRTAHFETLVELARR